MTPVFLIVQNALPYFRVFSYMGIPLAVLLCILLRSVGESGYWRRLMEWCGRKGAMISKKGSLGVYNEDSGSSHCIVGGQAVTVRGI